MRGTRLALTYLPRDGARPEVAFAISRKLGPAVVRNRCRRRIRPLLAEHARAGRLAPGAYLVQVRSRVDGLDAAVLAHDVDALLDSLDGALAARPAR